MAQAIQIIAAPWRQKCHHGCGRFGGGSSLGRPRPARRHHIGGAAPRLRCDGGRCLLELALLGCDRRRFVGLRARRAGGALRDITNRSTSPAVSPVADSTSSFEEEDWLGDGPAAALEFADGVDYECPAADRDGCVSEDLRMCYDQLEWLQTLARQQECSLTEVLATLVAFCNGEDAARKKVIFRNPRCRRCTAATQGGKKATARLGLAPAHLNWLRRMH